MDGAEQRASLCRAGVEVHVVSRAREWGGSLCQRAQAGAGLGAAGAAAVPGISGAWCPPACGLVVSAVTPDPEEEGPRPPVPRWVPLVPGACRWPGAAASLRTATPAWATRRQRRRGSGSRKGLGPSEAVKQTGRSPDREQRNRWQRERKSRETSDRRRRVQTLAGSRSNEVASSELGGA